MWRVDNRTPFEADSAWVRDVEGNKIWMVVVKATFDIDAGGRCRLAERAEPVRLMAEPYVDFGTSSLRHESDLAGIKPTTDVLVRGDALAPAGYRVTALDVSLQVGEIDKRLRIHGDRVWERSPLGGLHPSAAQPFERMPIVYERAYGGWDRSAPNPIDHRLEARNPVGTGFALKAGDAVGRALPNVEDARHPIDAWDRRPPPAGFAAIDGAWSGRRELAGTYDDAWQRDRFPMWAADFDPRYFNCAPLDQQPAAHLVGGEPVTVRNMSPGGTLAFRLPDLRFAFRTALAGRRIDHDGQLCTVIVEPNVPRVVMAWQTSLVCNRQEDLLEETMVVERRGPA
jgi:hypothetical protein